MKQQRGGTLLGLIIGVVIGLAVALVVALYVTKTPVPFMNKGQNRTPEQDAAEEKKNKDWDPNAPLQNKAKPAASAAPVTKPDVPAPAVKSGKSEKTEPKASTDPLGDLARAKAGGNEPFIWFVQVGAFRNPDDAETQRAKLSLTGVEARVTEKEISGRQVYRVRVGPFDRKDDAEKVETRLKTAGHETKVLREQR